MIITVNLKIKKPSDLIKDYEEGVRRSADKYVERSIEASHRWAINFMPYYYAQLLQVSKRLICKDTIDSMNMLKS